ncbi:OmpH family outer membrane protein [Aurantibacter sp.]|uniref:OmpH family outer membrane protein n=1 Tax=Aurantibacter sp. TaxID=2807103 RepID=UPI0035C8683B
MVITIFSSKLSFAQRDGAKIAYIDTDYILSNVDEYKQAQSQLATKVQRWKSEIESKLNVIKQQREALSNEKALLTKELFEERLEDLSFEEKEIIEYQQKRFGPQGDLMIQRKQLMQPVQDQIFQAVQDLATTRKYDFVFDKSADVVMLYSAERYDISDQVLRILNRASKREQANTRAEKREAEKDDVIEEEQSESQLERQRILEERKASRDSILAVKKEQLRIEREAEIQEKKEKREKREAERAELKEKNNSETTEIEENNNSEKSSENVEIPKTAEEVLEEKRQARLADRARRAKELEDKRKEADEARKKAKEEREADKAEDPN